MQKYKKKDHNQERGVDDWLMTYADMITLLLCFFAIFLSISAPKEEQFKTAREKVMEAFSSMDEQVKIVAPIQGNAVDAAGGQSILDHQAAILEQDSQTLDLSRPAQKGEEGEAPEKGKGKSKDGGDRIVTLEMPSAAFFDSGSSVLSDEGKTLLQGVIKDTLQSAQYKDYIATVEGHTDDVPINTLQFPSNWELSTARAAAVVRFFIEQGVDPQSLRAAGYADVFPKAPNRDANNVMILENQAQNRRVVIKLEKIEKLDKKTE